MRLFILAILLSSFSSVSGQYDEIIFEDYVYSTNIRSVAFHPTREALAPPILYLGNSQGLTLSFDDMDNVQRDYTYEIIHCNKDWTAMSELEPLEYIDGFQNEEIDDSSPSINTLVPYINYQLRLPNNDLSWIISGNYLLIVYEGGDVDDRIPVITRRFMIVDKKVNINIKQRRPMVVEKLRTHHEFDLVVNNKDFRIIDPRNNISVHVLQNMRWDSALKNLNPRFTVGNNMTIDNTGKISFPAYKEFRFADIRTLDFTSLGINSIDLNSDGTDVLLEAGAPKVDSYYSNIIDENGQFVIANSDVGTSRLHGDYANVIFTLKSSLRENEVYVIGEFTDWKADEMYRMRYSDIHDVYIAEILLKQGYYNYFFAEDVDGFLDARPIEGSWADTQNDYHIFVYLREPADRYDRLIGFSTIEY